MTSLAGRRVLVTRAAEDAVAWLSRLRDEGAMTEVMPCVRTERIAGPDLATRLHAALADAACLVVTSVHGVEAVAALAGGLRATLTTREIAAVGEATGAAVRTQFGRDAFIGTGGTSRALAEELVGRWGDGVSGRRVVVAGAKGGREDIEAVLSAAGATVARFDVYRTVVAPQRDPRRDLAREGVTDVLLASPSAVTGLLNQAIVGEGTRLVTIGPTTSAAVVAMGYRVAAESATPGIDAMMEALRCATGT